MSNPKRHILLLIITCLVCKTVASVDDADRDVQLSSSVNQLMEQQ